MNFDKYDLDSYRSFINAEGEFFNFGMDKGLTNLLNALADLMFSFSKLIYTVVDLAVEQLYKINIIRSVSGEVFGMSGSMYNSLYSSFGVIFFLITAGYSFWQFCVGNTKRAVTSVLSFIVVLGLANGMFVNGYGTTMLDNVNSVSETVESSLMSSVVVPVGESKEVDSVTAIREMYFISTIEQPFSLMNFGAAVLTDEQREAYLFKPNLDADTLKAKMDDINENVEDGSKTNRYFNNGMVFYKIMISFGALLMGLVLGVIVLVVALARFVIQILVLALVFVLPIVAIMSFIPQFRGFFFRMLGSGLALFGVNIMIGLGMMFVFYIQAIVDRFIIPSDMGFYFLNQLVKFFIFLMLYLFRKPIGKLVSGGMVESIKANMPDVRQESEIYGELPNQYQAPFFYNLPEQESLGNESETWTSFQGKQFVNRMEQDDFSGGQWMNSSDEDESSGGKGRTFSSSEDRKVISEDEVIPEETLWGENYVSDGFEDEADPLVEWDEEPYSNGVDEPLVYVEELDALDTVAPNDLEIPLDYVEESGALDVVAPNDLEIPLDYVEESGALDVVAPNDLEVPLDYVEESGTLDVVALDDLEIPLDYVEESGALDLEEPSGVEVPLDFVDDGMNLDRIEPSLTGNGETQYLEDGGQAGAVVEHQLERGLDTVALDILVEQQLASVLTMETVTSPPTSDRYLADLELLRGA